MHKNFAVVESGIVANILWLDSIDTANIAHFNALEIPDGVLPVAGWTYDGSVFAAPIIIKPLAEAQVDQLALIDNAYATANQSPITYLGTTFQADDASTVLMTQTLTIMQATGTPSVTWWDVNNVGVTLTTAQLVELGASIFARGQGYFVNKQTKKAAIRAATTVDAVQAITW